MFLYTRVVGLPEPAMDSYRQGLALWYPFYDFRAARGGAAQVELSSAMVAQPAAPLRFPLADWDDPGPMLAALRARATGVCRKLRRARRPTVSSASPRRAHGRSGRRSALLEEGAQDRHRHAPGARRVGDVVVVVQPGVPLTSTIAPPAS